ncbi:hypothetical protein GCM10009828_073080 [Actinoplanes couchii]|uniref:Uncharacterized protein n=1 Tax=Actinoplanes couchii TaxID=403638 RepID=A0ABQ3X0B9_9ACTN|nr:hypothetical protein Aco03nite_003850 [Actinoplanes couchii]
MLHLGVFLVDDTSWYGPVSWRKPVTFGLSFGITLISIGWVVGYLEMGRRLSSWLLGVFTVDCVVEVGGITLQAWRGVPSHFNTETPFDRGVAMTLAVGGAVLVGTLGTYALVALRGWRRGAGRVRGDSAERLAVRAGFALLLVSLASGVAMVARGTILFRTVSPEVAYETAGALKPVHGVALHAVLVLPLLAVALRRLSQAAPGPDTARHGAATAGEREGGRWARLDERGRVRIVGWAVGIYVACTVLALVFSLT